jgi:plastocyanin
MGARTRRASGSTAEERQRVGGAAPPPGDDVQLVTAGSTRTARLGLLVMTAGPLVAALGDPAVLVFAAPMLIVPAVVAFLVSRYGRWAHVLAAIVGALGLAVAVPGAWVFTDAPDSVFDVVPTAMFLVGGLLAILGGVAGTAGRWRTADLGWARAGAAALIGLAVLVSGALALTTSSDVDADLLASATEVRVDDRGFQPDDLALPPGQTVTLALRNEGRIAHTFTSDGLGVDVVLSPGEIAVVDVDVPQDVAGIQYWCVPHSQVGDDGRREWMIGELTAAAG